MIKLLLISFLTFTSVIFSRADDYEEYMRNIKFTVLNNDTGESFESTFDESLTSQGCNVEGKFALFTHGWMGSMSRWIDQLGGNLSFYRGGCVIFMNYSRYGDDADYFRVVSRFDNISRVMTQKLNQLRDEGVSPENIYMFGFSYGGRLVIESGIQFGKNEISSIDACDMAGPGFDFIYKKDPKEAAKNVQCIHTSLLGTQLRQCHQDWLMGYCGKAQPGGQTIHEILCDVTGNKCENQPINSHGLCPYYYILAFQYDYFYDANYPCPSLREPQNVPDNFKMGYFEDRKSPSIIGDFPSPTSKNYPYTYDRRNDADDVDYNQISMQ